MVRKIRAVVTAGPMIQAVAASRASVSPKWGECAVDEDAPGP